MPSRMIVTTGDTVDGFRISEYLGIVRGLVVRVPTPGQGFQALGKMLGGNFQAGAEMYAQVCEKARADAYEQMVAHAQQLGADAILAMRYDATDVGESSTEVLAYGTAVKLRESER
ncbi:MAG: YbjQ family protein [Pirellulales bacterium]